VQCGIMPCAFVLRLRYVTCYDAIELVIKLTPKSKMPTNYYVVTRNFDISRVGMCFSLTEFLHLLVPTIA
jgi:hypothetical protein